MKGIAHFCSGVAAASFLPQVVHLSAGGSLIMLWAGVGVIYYMQTGKLGEHFLTRE